MRNISLFMITLIIQSNLYSQDLLSGKYPAEDLKSLLISQDSWKPFPEINDRDAWSKLDPQLMKGYLEQANEWIDYDWPYIPATYSLLIDRTGDRDTYQQVSFQKRTVLGTMILAEIYENKGRFIDPIINGIWSICEESWWGVPAHLPKTEEYSGLMDVSDPFVDLFAAETLTFLAWADYFLGDKFDEVSPQIRKRIYYEGNKRIFEPLMAKHHWWMGEEGRRPNNWNPWICSNWLNSILLLEKDEEKRIQHVSKILVVLDEFLNPYPEDGGCDEGPSYWGAAAASLYDNIEILNTATNGAFVYVSADQKVKNMAAYIYKAQISKDYFISFADADPQTTVDGGLIYRFGKAVNDPDMMKFGAYFYNSDRKIGRFHYFRNFYELFAHEEVVNTEKVLPLPRDSWFPDLQVMISRDKEGTDDGFFVAAKGGHNAESHNHNDIGNFMVFYDGNPVLIDVGRGTYTRKVFSNERYDIWFHRSDHHNTPSINGIQQPPGKDFKATDASYKVRNSYVSLTENIGTAYPEDAGVNGYVRTIRLNRGKNVTVTDSYDLKRGEQITQHLMTAYPVELVKPGTLLINANGQKMQITYPTANTSVEIEKVKLVTMEDQGVIKKWGDNIYRINIASASPGLKGQFELKVSKM
ncbi:MAG: heparinase II/III family protein [Cyclobacteriaceae bacterium]